MTLALPQKLSPTAVFCTFHHHMDWSTTCILKHSTLHNFPSCHSNTPPPTSLDPAVFDSFKPSAILVLSPSPPAGVHCIWLQLHLQQVKWIWLVYTATPRPPPWTPTLGAGSPCDLWSGDSLLYSPGVWSPCEPTQETLCVWVLFISKEQTFPPNLEFIVHSITLSPLPSILFLLPFLTKIAIVDKCNYWL